MFEVLVSCAGLVVALVHGVITYRAGLRASFKIGAFGSLVPWLVWLGIAGGAYLQSGAGSADFRFTFWAGIAMIAVPGSLFWVAAAAIGSGLGAIAARLIQPAARNPYKTAR